ncbi:MAG: NAD-dependent dihydropyrimidine dehydrogenase subunit PreA [Oscillospiraceae bacterium]|nr:NAD-dependent dihydropyrimidine dehydrogenase subunit PreA [Oscillospiraceae bacterium]
MAATLRTTFAGISMPNPFMLSSAPPTTNCEMVARSFDAGWGGAVLKTMAYNLDLVRNVNPRITAVKTGRSIQGFTNFELGSPKPIDKWLKEAQWLKERFPEHTVFVSLLHTEGLIEEQWREVTRMFNDTGIDGYELNFSCSHGMAEGGGGAQVGGNETSIRMVTSWVREETNKPVMPKLPAMVPDLAGKARAAKSAGADAVAAINTLNSLPGIDLHTFCPYPSVGGNSAFQGLSGRAIKPVALRSVAQIAGGCDLPVSGMGGIYTWQDAAEFILAGAGSLQVCSSVMEYGYSVVAGMKQGLLDYMDEMGFTCIDDFCGKALPHIKAHNSLPRDYKLCAGVDESKCVGCGRCVSSCADSGYSAISLDNKKAKVDAAKCDGCGLCSQICPAGAISMQLR